VEVVVLGAPVGTDPHPSKKAGLAGRLYLQDLNNNNDKTPPEEMRQSRDGENPPAWRKKARKSLILFRKTVGKLAICN
jgi:hypothetical protein